jgi:hypothetical protein
MGTTFVWLPRFDFAPHPSATDGESLPVRRFVNVCPCKPIRQRSNESPPTGSGALYPKTNRAKARTMMVSGDIDDGKVPESQGKAGPAHPRRAKNAARTSPEFLVIARTCAGRRNRGAPWPPRLSRSSRRAGASIRLQERAAVPGQCRRYRGLPPALSNDRPSRDPGCPDARPSASDVPCAPVPSVVFRMGRYEVAYSGAV